MPDQLSSDDQRPRSRRPSRAVIRRRRIVVGALAALLIVAGFGIYKELNHSNTPTAAATASPIPSRAAPAPASHAPPDVPQAPVGSVGSIPAAGTTVINFLTSFIHPGDTATALALAGPGSRCTLAMTGAGNERVATPGVGPAQANSKGLVGWSWTISSTQAAGSYTITVSCSPGKTATSTLLVG